MFCEQGVHKLDWQPEQYRGKTGGSIPKILHHIFLDGEAEYDKCVISCHTFLIYLIDSRSNYLCSTGPLQTLGSYDYKLLDGLGIQKHCNSCLHYHVIAHHLQISA